MAYSSHYFQFPSSILAPGSVSYLTRHKTADLNLYTIPFARTTSFLIPRALEIWNNLGGDYTTSKVSLPEFNLEIYIFNRLHLILTIVCYLCILCINCIKKLFPISGLIRHSLLPRVTSLTKGAGARFLGCLAYIYPPICCNYQFIFSC